MTAEGRIAQFEYDAEAPGCSGLCVGILCRDGAVIAGECRMKREWHDFRTFKEKIFELHPKIVCAVAGKGADANVFLTRLELEVAEYIYNYNETSPCLYVAQTGSKIMISKADQIERRPFALSTLYMGWDEHYGYNLLSTDPSGHIDAWNAIAIGRNAASVNQLLMDKIGHNQVSLKEAKYVALEFLANNIGVENMNAMKVELGIFQSVGNNCQVYIHSHQEVMEICEKFKQKFAQKNVKYSYFR